MIVGAQKHGRTIARALPPRFRKAERPINTVLVDPDTLFRVGLGHILASTHFHVIAAVDAVDEVAGDLGPTKTPSLFILRLAGEVHAFVKDVTNLRIKYPGICVVCISQTYEPEAIVTLLCAGVNGLMLRSVSASTFVKALELVVSGERIVPQELLELTTSRMQAERIPTKLVPTTTEPLSFGPSLAESLELSSREHDILHLLINGEANKMIALKLSISEATVKVHVRAILRKIDVKNRTQAAIWALSHGLDHNVASPLGANGHVLDLGEFANGCNRLKGFKPEPES